MSDLEIVNWLLEGDVVIKYPVHRDLLSEEIPDLRNRISSEGWGAQFLTKRRPEGYWAGH